MVLRLFAYCPMLRLQNFISFLVLNLDDLNLILKSYAAFAITPFTLYEWGSDQLVLDCISR